MNPFAALRRGLPTRAHARQSRLGAGRRHRSARRSACCRASGRRSPWRCCCRPPTGSIRRRRSSCSPASTTAAMYGGSTTSILLNTPGESATIVTAHRRPPDGAQRPRRRGAGDGGHRQLRRRHARHAGAHRERTVDGAARARLWPGRLLRAHRARLRGHGVAARRVAHRRPAEPGAGRACSVSSASIGSAATRGSRFGMPYLLDGIDPVIVAIGLFAVGETLGARAPRPRRVARCCRCEARGG